jgi:hypothetical protein
LVFFEKRTPQNLFHEQFYLDVNPEVAAVANGSFSSVFEHYTRLGAAEGRSPVASTTISKLQEILKRRLVRAPELFTYICPLGRR